MADVLDVFGDRASPAFRKERPALVAARMAWARQRLVRDRAQAAAGPTPQGIGPGDRVLVELAPSYWWRGVVQPWAGAQLGEPGAHSALARVRLDDFPPEANHYPFVSGQVVERHRRKLKPLTPNTLTHESFA